jgi:uncharacterized protein YukE
MAFMIPDSSAMNVTAAGGGPITVLPTIITGSPEQIAAHVAQRVQQAEKFLQIIEQLNSATHQLSSAWSGGASEAAVQKIASTVSAFTGIVKVIQAGASLLSTSGIMVGSAQTAYTGVVSAVNPTVASLMSNPWTYSAAVALSTSASASLSSYIMAVQAALQALGAGQMMQQVTMLMRIAQEIEQLAASGGSISSLLSAGGLAGSLLSAAGAGGAASSVMSATSAASAANSLASASSVGGAAGAAGSLLSAGGVSGAASVASAAVAASSLASATNAASAAGAAGSLLSAGKAASAVLPAGGATGTTPAP